MLNKENGIEIRNPDGRLIAIIYPASNPLITGALEIKEKPWITRINFGFNGEFDTTHTLA